MIRKAVRQLLIEQPARKRSVGDWHHRFKESGEQIKQLLDRTEDSERNRRVLNHVIGIERWGQRRLRVGLGEPFIKEEYNGYRPARETSWDELKQQFDETRAETAALLKKFETEGINITQTVNHNQYGDLSLLGWMRYLDVHASLEVKKLR